MKTAKKLKRYTRRTDAAMTAYGAAAKTPNEPIDTLLNDFLTDMLHRYEADPNGMSKYDDPDPDPVEWLRGIVRDAVDDYETERRDAF